MSNQSQSLTRESSFNEAFEYLQSFRPPKEVLYSWHDGTHTDDFPNYFKNYGLSSHCYAWMEYDSEEAKMDPGGLGRYIREDGKPAFITVDNGFITEVSFYSGGLFGRLSEPARILFDEDGSVIGAKFHSEGFSHRMDGPSVIQLIRSNESEQDAERDVIYVAFHVLGELVDEFNIPRKNEKTKEK